MSAKNLNLLMAEKNKLKGSFFKCLKLLQLKKNKMVHPEQTRKESRAGIVTVITAVMGAKNSNLLMTEKINCRGVVSNV